MQTILLLRPWEMLSVVCVPLLVWVILVSRIRRFFQKRDKQRENARRSHCVCGYSLERLTVVRCPECGRIPGFDATAEELGLSNEQLERAHAAKVQRERSLTRGQIPPIPKS